MLRIIAAALMAAFASNQAAQAREIPATGLTFAEVVDWLKEKGQEATISTDGAGNKMISTVVGGVKSGVYLFDCKGERCGSIQFAIGWSDKGAITSTRLNEWNRAKRWGRAYFDTGKGIWVEMDVDMTPGGTYELLDDDLDTWTNTVRDFKAFFNLK